MDGARCPVFFSGQKVGVFIFIYMPLYALQINGNAVIYGILRSVRVQGKLISGSEKDPGIL